MAKRRKAGIKVGTRRTARRGKQAEDTNSIEGASSTTSEPSVESRSDSKLSAEPPTPASDVSESQPGTTTEKQIQQTFPTNFQPVVALHKKFGKYRCLFNNDDVFSRKYDNCSDSETNSSIEIKVTDPCGGSESDSNAAVENHCDAIGTSISQQNHPKSQCNLNEISLPCSSEPRNELETSKDLNSQSNIVMENINENNQQECMKCDEMPAQDNESTVDLNNYYDDEVITIVQIVEDDNQESYYDINIENSNEINSPSDVELIHQEDGKKENDIRKDFAKLNLLQMDSTPYSPSNRSMFETCNPDQQTLNRPDPSITPSSIISDDSNSSRVTNEQNQTNSNDSSESSPTGVRRSSRIKTISTLKQKTKGYGLVKTPLKKALITQTKLKLEEISENQDKSYDGLPNNPPSMLSFPIPSEMPVKVKSRWRRSSELEMGANSPAISPLASPSLPQKLPVLEEIPQVEEEIPSIPLTKEAYDKIIEERMNQFQHLDENEYLCERMISKETKKMICDCFMTKEELERGELACGDDCLNRLLMIECNSRCPVGDRCTNRRFQKKELASLKVFYADKKGCGVEASADISSGEFLMEYVGEVLDSEQFYKRAQAYSDENNLHHYFMSLKGDTVIDATLKGNISRFINHSCEPNAETQKWTVNGELRIGFFSKRDISTGEEITFDYQFQRFGKEAQRCYCGAENCRGWIGAEPDSEDEEDEEEEDVSTSKSETSMSSEQDLLSESGMEQQRPATLKTKKDRKYKSKKPELGLDADMEEELEALARTGVKNQSHTLRLSRTVVRARARSSQVALLRLLRDADLPCRRLFLDYRGLRLLAPWCSDAPLHFRHEMLLTVDRLPIPNKTMVQESRFFTIVERWLSCSDIQMSDPPVLIDEATGLPTELPNPQVIAERTKENAAILQKVKDLCGQLLERWSSLKEVFKIPKKERIQQMKEHERQANVERRAADSSGSRDRERDRRDERERERERDRDRDRRDERDRERDRERERERERDRERDRDRKRERDKDDRDRRKRRSSPDGRRSIRMNERVLAAVPPMSKEERRRAFAEAAEAAEQARRVPPAPPGPAQPAPHHLPHPAWPPFWPQDFAQMFPQGMMGNAPNMINGPNMMGGPPNMMAGTQNMMGQIGGPMPNMPGIMAGVMPSEIPQEWIGPNGEYQGPPGFCPPFNGPQPFCMPQPNMMSMSGFGMGGFMFGQQMAGGFPAAQPAPSATPTPVPAPGQANNVQMEEAGEGEVVLPSMWRSAVDARGRRYYYHVKLRRPQWEPPPPPPDESSSEEEVEALSALDSAIIQRKVKGKLVEGVNGIYEVIKEDSCNGLIPDHALLNLKPRKRRPGLVSERPISPRTEEDKLAGRLEVKRYKQTKEKLRRRRERLLQRARRLAPHHLKFVDFEETDSESTGSETGSPAVPSPDAEDSARRIKEQFRSGMARVMVQHLNPYRRPDAPAGRITCTADFKHLARKLTHFVMLKELKHCRTVGELVVTDSVRSKAKMFVKKYMMKFGPVYRRPPDEAD